MADIAITSNTGTFTGSAEDDLFTWTPASAFNLFTGTIDGGDGVDTVRLNSSIAPGASPFGLSTQFIIAPSAGGFVSIERIEYASLAGQWLLLAAVAQDDYTGTLIGGVGRDGLVLEASGQSVATMPNLQFTNWGPSTGTAGLGDYVLLQALDANPHTLNARDDFGSLQILRGGDAADILNGSNGTDSLYLTRGGDSLFGNGGDDFILLPIFGPTTPTVINGGSVDGGEGHDTLIVQNIAVFNDVDFESVEEINFTAAVLPGVSPFASLTINTDGGRVAPQILLSGSGALQINFAQAVQFDASGISFAEGASVGLTIYGSDADDIFRLKTFAGGELTLFAGGGDDKIFGNELAENQLNGDDGNDLIVGGLFDDDLLGGNGNDSLRGGDGDDTLMGSYGDDELFGGRGFDAVSYGDLFTTELASPADPFNGVTVDLSLTEAQDTGLGGIDTIRGVESVEGSNYNDLLIGSNSANVLFGGNGSDVLIGGRGADFLIGGMGPDYFIYNATAESQAAEDRRDVIGDFNHNEGDKIGLRNIDANTRVAEDQAFFLGGSTFTRQAGELIQIAGDFGGILVQGDINGDARADFAVLVYSFSGPLVADDFIL